MSHVICATVFVGLMGAAAPSAFAQKAPAFDPYNPPSMTKVVPLPESLVPKGSQITLYKNPAQLSHVISDFVKAKPNATLHEVAQFGTQAIQKHGFPSQFVWLVPSNYSFVRAGNSIVEFSDVTEGPCEVGYLYASVAKLDPKAPLFVAKDRSFQGSIVGLARSFRLIIKKAGKEKEFYLPTANIVQGYKSDLSKVYVPFGLQPTAQNWWNRVGKVASASALNVPVLTLSVDASGTMRFESEKEAYAYHKIELDPEQDTTPRRPGMFIDSSGAKLWLYDECGSN